MRLRWLRRLVAIDIIALKDRVREFLFGPRTYSVGNGASLVYSVCGKEPVILIEQGGKVIFDIRSSGMVPENTEFIFSPAIGWKLLFEDFTPGSKTFIIMGSTAKKNAISALFHEAGHINCGVDSELQYFSQTAYIGEALRDKKNAYPPSRLRALRNAWENTMISERNAWAFALRAIRKLQRELGVAIIKNIGGLTSIRREINKCLSSHENYFLDAELWYLGYKTRESARKFLQELR